MTVSEYNNCVEQFADNVFRFILKNIKDKEKAKDIVQDTFEKMWVKRHSITNTKAKSYLFTAAHRTMIDLIRREKRKGDFEEVKQESLSHTSGQYSGLQEVLHEALDNLPAAQRSVVLLRDYEGYSYKEIAQVTDLNEAQVKVYIYRARKFLKNYIGSIDMVL